MFEQNTNTTLEHISEPLPLVEAVFEQFQHFSFSDVCIIGAQHILPTTLQMFNSFFSRGLKPSNVHLIGKCYSTDQYTYQQMCELGVKVCPTSMTFKKGQSFDTVYKQNIRKFLSRTRKFLKSCQPHINTIVVLDDGGSLILQAREILREFSYKIIGIEQTTSGFETLKYVKHDFPVINVARSHAKLQYESPIIAETVARQIQPKIEKYQKLDSKILIAGNGAIGQALYRKLRHDFQIQIYDRVLTKSCLLEENVKSKLSSYDIIIGCTGNIFLKPVDFKYLKPGTILISASSSDREFSAHKLQQSYPGLLNCHDDFEVNGIQIINCGFPANFGGNSIETDPPIFQLTRSLLAGGILTGTLKEYPYMMVPLDATFQKFIINRFKELDFDILYA